MRLDTGLAASTPKELDFCGKRVLIFITGLESVRRMGEMLARLPDCLRSSAVELLIVQDFPGDQTSAEAFRNRRLFSRFATTLLRPPENQGYGGNQKLGYRYAIEQGFDIVAALPASSLSAAEHLPELLQPLLRDEADVVFGSPRGALAPGRGLLSWKQACARLLRAIQHRMLGTKLSGPIFGCRLYATEALAQLPFERNSAGLRFNAEILIQLVLKKLRMLELTFPGCQDEESREFPNARYAWGMCKAIARARLHQINLFFDRKFDIAPRGEIYDSKLGFTSSHTMAISAARAGTHVLDVGCGSGYVAAELLRKGCRVTGIDRNPSAGRSNMTAFIQWDLDRNEFPVNVSRFDQILLLDIIEHLKRPEEFMDDLRFATGCKRPEIVITTANIAFVATRLMLLLGQFNYGKKGILDATHTRLFTFRSLAELLEQAGYKVLEMRGIPAPFPKALGNHLLSRFLIRFNQLLIRISKRLFAYQIFARAEAKPTVQNLLADTAGRSAGLCWDLSTRRAGLFQHFERVEQSRGH